MIDRIDIKNMHSKELRDIRNMIREELDFRADVDREITQMGARSVVPAARLHTEYPVDGCKINDI